MKLMILYPYEYEFSALTIQARLLEKGLRELSHEVICLCARHTFSKELEYCSFNPDLIISIGFWGDIPRLIHEPMKRGFRAIPWFNANGWVANYHETLNSLPLVLVTSDWVKNTYIRDGVKPDNIHPVHIGIDADLFKPLSKDNPKVSKVKEMFGIKEDEKMILTAGGDVTSKGAQEIFHALAKIKDKIPKWKYVCKSWPSDNMKIWRSKELQLVNELDIAEKIIFHDEIMHHAYMPYLLNACDIYAAPSRLEGFGMIHVEAMACGKPVISMKAMGPSETILHEKTGFLADIAHEVKLDSEWVYPSMGFEKKHQIEFPVSKTFEYRANVDQLADFLLRLTQDDDLREKMGQAARQHVIENLNYKVTAKRIVDLIENTF